MLGGGGPLCGDKRDSQTLGTVQRRSTPRVICVICDALALFGVEIESVQDSVVGLRLRK